MLLSSNVYFYNKNQHSFLIMFILTIKKIVIGLQLIFNFIMFLPQKQMQEFKNLDFNKVMNNSVDSGFIKNNLKPSKGTTTLAFIFREGIIVAVDSRATQGAYIADQTVNKVIEINDYMLGTMAGGAADCFYWEKAVGNYAKAYELKYGKRITVSNASLHLSDNLYKYKGRGLSVGSMICGYDKDVPKIYMVTDDGSRIESHIFSVGSGSLIATGILQTGYRFDLSKEEAIALWGRSNL